MDLDDSLHILEQRIRQLEELLEAYHVIHVEMVKLKNVRKPQPHMMKLPGGTGVQWQNEWGNQGGPASRSFLDALKTMPNGSSGFTEYRYQDAEGTWHIIAGGGAAHGSKSDGPAHGSGGGME